MLERLLICADLYSYIYIFISIYIYTCGKIEAKKKHDIGRKACFYLRNKLESKQRIYFRVNHFKITLPRKHVQQFVSPIIRGNFHPPNSSLLIKPWEKPRSLAKGLTLRGSHVKTLKPH